MKKTIEQNAKDLSRGLRNTAEALEENNSNVEKLAKVIKTVNNAIPEIPRFPDLFNEENYIK